MPKSKNRSVPSQAELFPREELKLVPERGRATPRFWIRRMAIWSEPGGLLREITFRPGLNIVWSPDPGETDMDAGAVGVIGHGSGKTMFCRLLRYCLGEETFAPDSQRDRIGKMFPEGYVGLEVVLDGTSWVIARPLGIRRRHFAVEGGDLDTVLSGDVSAAGIDPFLTAITSQLLTLDAVQLLPTTTRGPRAWLAALAWATRDQECRFDHALDWRSASSESRSPVRDWNRLDVRNAVRAFLRALTPAELETQEGVANLEGQVQATSRELDNRNWEIDRLRERLLAGLGLPETALSGGELDLQLLNRAATEKFNTAATLPIGIAQADLNSARAAEAEARDLLSGLEGRMRTVAELIDEVKLTMPYIQAELPILFVEMDKADKPVCRLCEVPIDRVLAEGCKLSHTLPDLTGAARRYETCQANLAAQQKKLEDLRQERSALPADIALARQAHDQRTRNLKALKHAQDARNDEFFRARRLIDDVRRYDELIRLRAQARERADGTAGNVARSRAVLETLRAEQGDVFRRLTQHFDAIIRNLVGPTSSGRVAVSAQGIDLSVQMGGERSTVAIDLLKVLAFDLAALCLSMEGETQIPAFLVHDSPREADLGQSIYHRLFRLAGDLETKTDQPIFQYIVTTTTAPPGAFLAEPWMRLKLQGSPASERLLRRDL
jgi:hypothetical protein